MGNLAASELPRVATAVLEFTALPMAISMWLYSESLMSWALATALVLVWEIGISYFFGLHNPLYGLLGTDLSEGMTILGVLVFLCLSYALVGSFIHWLLDGEEVLPYYTIFPLSARHFLTRMRKNKNKDEEKPTGINRFGMINLPRPYIHLMVTTVLFGITVVIPHLVYAFVMTENLGVGIACVIVIPLVGYVLSFAYWYIWPDAAIWGAHAKNYKALGDRYPGRDNKATIKRDTKNANSRIFKTTLLLAVTHLLHVFVLALVRYFRSDVDWNWTFAAILVAVAVIVAIVCYGALYVFKGKRQALRPKADTGDDDGGDEGDNDGDVDLDDDDTATAVDTKKAVDAANTSTVIPPSSSKSAFGSTFQLSQRITNMGAV